MKFLAPIPSQFLDETGTPYSSGSVSVYIHGEPRLADIYQNASGNELAPNPFTLDSHGMWMAFVDSGKSYDYLVKDAGGNVVAPYYNVVVPGTEGVSGVSIESPRGSIEVTESVVGGRKEFGIDVNADSFAHSHGSFSHDAVVGASGSFDYDSFTEVGVEGDDIYLSQGRLTLDSGLYHVSVNVLLENSAEDGNSYDVSFEIDGTQFKKSWDNTFVHSETVEVGIDISVDEDGHAVVPSISGLPEGMSCGIPRLDVHRVDGLCVGSSSSTVEHDSTLEGDGSHDNPLSVKDYSSIRSDLEGVIEDLADHETDPGAHHDIRNELSLKEDKSNKVTAWSENLSDDNYPSERLVKESLDNLPPGTAVKGDAENEYRTGNVNLTPANIGAATTTQGAKADSAIQGVSVNGTALTPDSSNVVDVSVPTSSNATPLMDGSAAAGVGTHWARGDHRHPTDTSREAVNNKVQSINDTSTTDYPSSKAVADFVNSSVATNTAAFLGNFSLEDLGLTYPATEVQIASALNSHTWPTGYPTNNDYVYVEIRNPQSTIDDKVQRYKYRDGLASWGYEYTLNNSSFTAEEKASIDSGITSQDVTNLRADHTTLDTHVADTSNPHQVTAAQVGAEPAFSVLPVSKGGTGKDNEKAALNKLTSQMTHYDTQPTDDTLLVQKFGTSTDSNGALYTRTYSYLWAYIKSKISSVLGLSEYNGVKSFSGNADTANSTGFATSATYASSATLATTATNYASGGGIDTALQGKLGTSGDGSNVSVTPDGTSTGTDIGSSSTLKAWAQKFKNLVGALKALAFKDAVGTSDISNDAVTADKVKDNETLPVNISGNAATANSASTASTANNGTYKVYVNQTSNPSFNDAKTAYNSGKSIVAIIGETRSGTTIERSIPLSYVEYSSGNVISAFVFTQEYPYSDENSGVTQIWMFTSSAWSYSYALTKVSESAQNFSGDGSNVSVTPDGTSTGTDIGSSSTLKAWAQKFKNLVASMSSYALTNGSYPNMSVGSASVASNGTYKVYVNQTSNPSFNDAKTAFHAGKTVVAVAGESVGSLSTERYLPLAYVTYGSGGTVDGFIFMQSYPYAGTDAGTLQLWTFNASGWTYRYSAIHYAETTTIADKAYKDGNGDEISTVYSKVSYHKMYNYGGAGPQNLGTSKQSLTTGRVSLIGVGTALEVDVLINNNSDTNVVLRLSIDVTTQNSGEYELDYKSFYLQGWDSITIHLQGRVDNGSLGGSFDVCVSNSSASSATSANPGVTFTVNARGYGANLTF